MFLESTSSKPIELAHEEQDDCGVCAVYDSRDRSFEEALRVLMIQANRGEHSNGIAFIDQSGELRVEKHVGKPDPNLYSERSVARFALSHNRYTTSSTSDVQNAQPLVAEYKDQFGKIWSMALGHNGNVQKEEIRLDQDLPGTSDTAHIAQLIVESEGRNWLKKLRNSIPQINGSMSCTMLTDDGIWAFRDFRGNRPLWVGEYEDGTVLVASETHALETRAGKLNKYYPVAPGEVIHIDLDGTITHHQIEAPGDMLFCSLEALYLENHLSRLETEGYPLTTEARTSLGARLAEEDLYLSSKTETEREHFVSVGIPNGGIPYADGFAKHTRIEVVPFLIKNELYGRSYITTNGNHAEIAAKKIESVEDQVARLVSMGATDIFVLDDSLIRGSQIAPVAQLIARELARVVLPHVKVHVRICAPRITNRCDLGIVIREEELFYNTLSEKLRKYDIELSENPEEHLGQLLKFLGIASLQHISREGLVEALSGQKLPEGFKLLANAYGSLGYCIACMQTAENPQQAKEFYRDKKPISLEF